MADVGTRQFNGIILAGQSSGTGVLKLSKSGLAWTAREGSRSVEVTPADMVALEWLRGAKGQILRCAMRGGSSVKFDGLKEVDFAAIEDFVGRAQWGKELHRAKQAALGWSWGAAKVTGSTLAVKTGRDGEYAQEIFDLPLGEVAQVNMPSKNEVAMEFHVDDTAGPLDECLVEMRLATTDEDQASDLFRAVKAKADSSAFAGESLVSFDDLPLLVPRGKYDVDLYPNHLKLHGKSVDYKILYASVTRLFLLPKPDEIHVAFIMSLDPPIRQGNTMYPHMVFQFKNEEQISVSIKIDPEELRTKYNDKLKPTERAEKWRIFSKVVRTITGRPLHVPKTFESKDKQRAVRTSLGANEGYLFFLESSLFFVNKPPTYIRFDDIDVVEFKRMDLERRFDLAIATNSGHHFLFNNIDRSEFDNIYNFLSAKDVTMEGARDGKGGRPGRVDVAALDLDDDEDESEDDDFDPTAARARRGKGDRGDDEDDEVDDMDDDELDQKMEAQAAREDHDEPTRKKPKKTKR